MSQENELQAYRCDGFAVLRQVVPTADIDRVRGEICDVFRVQLSRFGLADRACDGQEFEAGLTRLFAENMQAYLAAAKATQLSPALHGLGASEAVLRITKRFGIEQPLIAVRPVVHIVSDALRVPGGYHRTPAHQDWRSVQGSLDALVVWLPLVPVDAGFGALEVWPGSHRKGLLATRPDPFGNVVEEAAIDPDGFVPVEAEPGDAVVFSMFTVHRTGAEQRPGIRWAVSLRYNNAAAEEFVDHGFPNPFVYKSQDELLVPNFPSQDSVASIFDSDDDA